MLQIVENMTNMAKYMTESLCDGYFRSKKSLEFSKIELYPKLSLSAEEPGIYFGNHLPLFCIKEYGSMIYNISVVVPQESLLGSLATW